jgi:hypothetical protein
MPQPTQSPGATAGQTPRPIRDVNAARSALGNIRTAIESLSLQGEITASARQQLELRLDGINDALASRDYPDAGRQAAELDAAIVALIDNGEMADSAELAGEVDKLRAALPLP